MGPFFLTPTPKRDNPFKLGLKSIPVALSIIAAWPHDSVNARRSKVFKTKCCIILFWLILSFVRLWCYLFIYLSSCLLAVGGCHDVIIKLKLRASVGQTQKKKICKIIVQTRTGMSNKKGVDVISKLPRFVEPTGAITFLGIGISFKEQTAQN